MMQLLMPSLHLLEQLLIILLQGLDIPLSLLLELNDKELERRYSALRLLRVGTAAAVLAVGILLLRLILTDGYFIQVHVDLQPCELFHDVIEHVVIVCNVFCAIGDQFVDTRLQEGKQDVQSNGLAVFKAHLQINVHKFKL